MTRYRYYTATTLDGFLADEHHSLDWLFEQEGGDQPSSPDGSPVDYDAFFGAVGALVMGASTYRFILAQLAHGDDPGMPDELPWFVFTHRQLDAPVGDVTFLTGQPAAHRARIEAAASGRDVWMVGGGALAADFAEAGMLDDILLTFAPVTLGAGQPLFPRPFDLRLREHGRTGPFLAAVYDVLGPRPDPSRAA
jgi:dihydrofolate reductase